MYFSRDLFGTLSETVVLKIIVLLRVSQNCINPSGITKNKKAFYASKMLFCFPSILTLQLTLGLCFFVSATSVRVRVESVFEVSIGFPPCEGGLRRVVKPNLS
jgi:hypothetical protein